MTPADESGSAPVPTERAELEKDIEQTRNQLADTVEALAYKADVKARLTEKTHELTDQAKDRATELTSHARDKASELTSHAKDRSADLAGTAKQVATRPASQQAAAVGLAGVVVLLVWWVRRRRS